jgi:hypothetical protein
VERSDGLHLRAAARSCSTDGDGLIIASTQQIRIRNLHYTSPREPEIWSEVYRKPRIAVQSPVRRRIGETTVKPEKDEPSLRVTTIRRSPMRILLRLLPDGEPFL